MLHFGVSDAMPRYATPRLRQNARNYGRANVTSLFSTGYTVGVVGAMVHGGEAVIGDWLAPPSKHQGLQERVLLTPIDLLTDQLLNSAMRSC
jgi:hypothetical protein